MRQAGRVLPEYRALKQNHTFLELARTPELAAEVTLQPVRRFDFDAAILFSDILVIPEAMGQPYHFRETGGVQMEFALRSAADVDRLAARDTSSRLQYMAQALRLVKPALAGRTALIGFAGSPWTLANFMIEGGSSAAFTGALRLLREEPLLYARLAEKLAGAVADCLLMQIEAGAEAVQIFDTLGGLLPPELFEEGSARWIRQIVGAIRGRAPVIVFSKGVHSAWDTLLRTGADVLGVDHLIPLARVRAALPDTVALQGNLDPAILTGPPEAARAATQAVLDAMLGRCGHIFNLGHGVPPESRLETLAAVIDCVRGAPAPPRPSSL